MAAHLASEPYVRVTATAGRDLEDRRAGNIPGGGGGGGGSPAGGSRSDSVSGRSNSIVGLSGGAAAASPSHVGGGLEPRSPP